MLLQSRHVDSQCRGLQTVTLKVPWLGGPRKKRKKTPSLRCEASSSRDSGRIGRLLCFVLLLASRNGLPSVLAKIFFFFFLENNECNDFYPRSPETIDDRIQRLISNAID